MERKPLTGIKVLDFTRLYAGPFCTMLLGDLGADVVKVEAAGGDPIRRQGPPFHKEQSMSFLAVNRNKRSIVLDLKSDDGLATAKELAAKADVLVENFRPGVMDRLGLGYEALSQINPRLVYACMSGMGADGPCKDTGGFDLTIQAEAGYMSITGERGGAPIKLGTSAFDLICGQYAMGAIMTSLFERERTGKGAADRDQPVRERHHLPGRRGDGIFHPPARAAASGARNMPGRCPTRPSVPPTDGS